MSEETNEIRTIDSSMFKEYADIKFKIEELTEQAKEISNKIVNIMNEMNLDKVESNLGTFSFTTRRSWSYPDDIAKLETTFKEAKKQSEKDGTATFTETKSLTFRGKNNE